MDSRKKQARIAGLLYTLVAITAVNRRRSLTGVLAQPAPKADQRRTGISR